MASLQIMYGIDGHRELTETTRDDLSGYAGARPVRIGNGAFDQRQNDVFGAVLDSILLHTRKSQRLPRRLWPIVQSQAECATRVWREPDQGIWEARGKPQHYVSSKLMCWVALDRAAKLAGIRGDAGAAGDLGGDGRGDPRGRARARRPRAACCASTTTPIRWTPRRCWRPCFGFLPADDERLRSDRRRIADDLTEDGFVLRYRTGRDRRRAVRQGGHVPDLLVLAGLGAGGRRRDRSGPGDLMERLLRVGVAARACTPRSSTSAPARHLGNFPQAFSHLALIEAAARIILPEMLAQY